MDAMLLSFSFSFFNERQKNISEGKKHRKLFSEIGSFYEWMMKLMRLCNHPRLIAIDREQTDKNRKELIINEVKASVFLVLARY